MWKQNNDASRVHSCPQVKYMYFLEYGTSNIIYYLRLCIHGLRYVLVTRSFIAPTGPLSLVNITEEKQSGLGSIFSFKCSFCGHLNEVKSPGEHKAGSRGPLVNDINTRAVLGSLQAGMGNTHLNNLLSTINIPTMNHQLFKRREREVGNALENIARESCKINLNLEKKNGRAIF